MDRLYKYVDDIKTGKIVSCNEIKQAVTRFETDLLRDDIEFREDKANHAIRFIEILQHYTDKFNNKQFVLEPWQVFIVANIFGFYIKDTNLRRFNTAYIEIARKNGKTALSAAIALYCLFDSNGSQVYIASNSKEQATVCLDAIKGFTKKLDPSGKYLQRYRNTVNYKKADSLIRVLPANSDKLDGLNASCYVLDEYHAAKTSEVRDVLKSSQGMRENPLEIVITTAGLNRNVPCFELRRVAKEILAKAAKDDSLFAVIYTLDNDEEIKDKTKWIKSNPNLNTTVTLRSLEQAVNSVLNNPSELNAVLTKQFNIWCDSNECWISEDYINNCTQKINIEYYKGSNCYIGVDLSSVSDLTAVTYMIPKDGKLIFKTHYYLPIESENSKKDIVNYKNLQRQGYITLTSGNVVDYDYIIKDIKKINKTLFINMIGYDSWNSTQWAVDMSSEGYNLTPYSQSIGNFSKPTKEFQRLILSGKIIIDDNPLTRMCFSNVVIKKDFNGNEKPSKESNKNKIDGVIAMIEALGIYLNDPNRSNDFKLIVI